MAKKTKKIQKQAKVEDNPQAQPQRAFSSDHDIFSEGFKERLSQFVGLTREVLTLKGTVEGTDQSSQISRRRDQMSEKVEQAAGNILREELGSLQDWIKEQQEILSEDIIRIKKAYQENRNNLLGTGAFTESEVKDHLAKVHKKADQKQEVYDNYEGLLNRCKNIYS